MDGVYLKFFVLEKQRVHGRLMHEWLLELARAEGVSGGSVYRAVAGYGRHGVVHEERFFELAGELPVLVEFATDEASAQRLLARIGAEGQHLSYMRIPAQFGLT